MRQALLRTSLLLLAVLLTAGFLLAQEDSYQARRQQAVQLYESNNYVGALPILEKLAQEKPDDVVVLERLGMCILANSARMDNVELRKAERVRARTTLLKAKALGDDSNLLNILLEGIPEDGGTASFSDRAEVDATMRAAESAFTSGDLDKALQGYKQALILDPKLYEAALFAGDVYFKQHKFELAGEWFARAVQIDADRETAYRYWGDALMGAGDMRAARDKFIAAIVAEPYTRASWAGTSQWAQRFNLKLSQPNIQSPNSFQVEESGNATITVDPKSLDKKDGGSAWLMYPLSRVAWRNKKFAETFPKEKTYRHSLAEEAEALTLVAVSAEEQRKKSKNTDPALQTLIKLKNAGLIEAYVLLGRPDQGIAQDYAEYRRQHRDKLLQYLSEYVVPPPPQ